MRKKLKGLFLYSIILGCFVSLMYWIVQQGTKLESIKKISIKTEIFSHWKEFIHTIVENLSAPLTVLLAQIITIIIFARIFGWICKKIGQPTVIGEIIAGIVLGPSLIGLYFPEFTNAIFPDSSMGNLQFLSQFGLILFMFIVGMEIDTSDLKTQARDAIVVSNSGIIIPFALGMGLAYFLFPSFSNPGASFASFGLFLGIAMSITAFPVLARIVQERGIHKTRLGTIILTCAAIDDITAWCLLAAVIAIVKAGSFLSSLYIILLAIIYVLIMIRFVRPFLKRVGDLHSSRENLSKPVVAIFFLFLILSSWATEIIGIHALFGAFMAGAIMPENSKFRNVFTEKLEDVSMVLLLPLFFVYTGLRTEIGLLNHWNLWLTTLIIILVAIIGKFVGSALAAKAVGQNWKDSLTIGALMNTRGLMELVVLNIGYDLKILSPEIFAMFVIMALVTTFLTGPALDSINYFFKIKPSLEDLKRQMEEFRILISFGRPESGKSLIKLANGISSKFTNNLPVTVMHLFPGSNSHHYNLKEYENESFEPIIEESIKLNQKIETIFKVTDDINSDIADYANNGNYDLLLIGVGHSIYEGSSLGKIIGMTNHILEIKKILNKRHNKKDIFEYSPFDLKTRRLLTKSKIPVGILIDKKFNKTERLIIPVEDRIDPFILEYSSNLLQNNNSDITFIGNSNEIKVFNEFIDFQKTFEPKLQHKITFKEKNSIDNNFLKEQDLMLLTIDCWNRLVETKTTWLHQTPSTVIFVNKISK